MLLHFEWIYFHNQKNVPLHKSTFNKICPSCWFSPLWIWLWGANSWTYCSDLLTTGDSMPTVLARRHWSGHQALGASCWTTADSRLPSSHWPEDLTWSSYWMQKKNKICSNHFHSYLDVLDDLWVEQPVKFVIFRALSVPLLEQILVPEKNKQIWLDITEKCQGECLCAHTICWHIFKI